MSEREDQSDELYFLRGGGTIGELIRGFDWTTTSLGDPRTWPETLRIAVSIMLNTSLPVTLNWGRELLVLFNEAFLSALSEVKVPRSLGVPAPEVWPEIWKDVEPAVRASMVYGRTTLVQDQRLFVNRHVPNEEIYVTMSFGPLLLETGKAGGVFICGFENTRNVITQRQLQTRREMASQFQFANAPEDAFISSMKALALNPWDIPFALMYLVAESGREAELHYQVGLDEPGEDLAPRRIDVNRQASGLWPVGRVLATGKQEMVANLRTKYPGLKAGPWIEPPDAACVLPIVPPGEERVVGALILGISPRLPFTGEYRTFFELIAVHMGTAVSVMASHAEERRQVEERLARTEAFALVMALHMTLDGRWIKVPPTFCQFLGYSEEELLGKPFKEITFLEDFEKDWEQCERLIKGEIRTFDMEKRFIHRNGETVWAYQNVSVVTDKQGVPVHFLVYVREITDAKKAERELREAKEVSERSLRQLEIIMENMTDGLIVANADGYVIRINRAAAELFNFKQGISLGHLSMYQSMVKIYDMQGNEVQPEEWPLARALRGEIVTHCELRFESVEDALGSPMFMVGCSAAPIYDASGNVIMAILTLHDITVQKETENKLLATAHELARSNEDLQQFAYIVSHDLQEPLRMVTSYLDLLVKRYGDRIDKDGQEFIHFALDGSRRMHDLIFDLLTYSRAGAQKENYRHVQLGNLLERVLANLSHAIKENDAVVEREPLPEVWGDESQLLSVFQNLIGNAIKFRKEERPIICVGARASGAFWEFMIADNGIGIDPRDQDRIFLVFQRLHSRRKYRGTGIGLAICKKIIERHGGRIWVESIPGEGSTFHFTLPRGRPTE